MNQALVDFYAGTAPDIRGRMIAEIHQWPDAKLEAVHDYIQWLFPLNEASAFNHDAPLLDQETIDEFGRTMAIQRNLFLSIQTMFRFYGFHVDFETGEVSLASNFQQQSANWLQPNDHNHLRITRILKCLMLLNHSELAQAFHRCLVQVAEETNDRISPKTLLFWEAAVQ